MRRAGAKSLQVRALLGVVALVVAVFVVFYDLRSLAWLEHHKAIADLFVVAFALFHVWNTYQARPPYV